MAHGRILLFFTKRVFVCVTSFGLPTLFREFSFFICLLKQLRRNYLQICFRLSFTCHVFLSFCLVFFNSFTSISLTSSSLTTQSKRSSLHLRCLTLFWLYQQLCFDLTSSTTTTVYPRINPCFAHRFIDCLKWSKYSL